MAKAVIGWIFSDRNLGKDEEILLKAAKKRDIELVLFNTSKEFSEEELEEKVKRCDIIFNNSAEDFAIEVTKTIEELGKKVLEPSKVYFYTEDKWMFYLLCKKHNIPTPETILLSEDIMIAKKELKEFNHWPVVLKRIQGTCGEYVDRAETLSDAERIIKRFWKKGIERLPVIAQEFIQSPSYRVMVIGDKIVQTVLKEHKGWKATGVYAKTFKKFRIDKELRDLVKKTSRVSKISVLGIDFLRKKNKWLVLEVNSEPAFDFFENERKVLIEETLNYLIRMIHR